jgi:hypothetical protein
MMACSPSRTMARAPGRSFDPGGSPPQTITRQRAPMACASAMARRLSSMAAARPAASAAGTSRRGIGR